jgi:hypothetical protein
MRLLWHNFTSAISSQGQHTQKVMAGDKEMIPEALRNVILLRALSPRDPSGQFSRLLPALFSACSLNRR